MMWEHRARPPHRRLRCPRVRSTRVTGNRTKPESDEWSDWLLHRRYADDSELAAVLRPELERYADRVLDAAQLEPGITLADIGAGDGLVGFRALHRVGPSLRVVMCDISRPMLRHVEEKARVLGLGEQCSFHCASAENLVGIAEASVDVVTTRAALAYVADKGAALREFHRILKPGGRISLAEPILRDEALAVAAFKIQLDSRPADDLDKLSPLIHRWKAAQFPDTAEKIVACPLVNFSERDLVRIAQETGFKEIHMEFHIDLSSSETVSWEIFIDHSPHPWAPSLKAILGAQFNAEEQQLLEQALRPQVQTITATALSRMAYLVAQKPSPHCFSR